MNLVYIVSVAGMADRSVMFDCRVWAETHLALNVTYLRDPYVSPTLLMKRRTVLMRALPLMQTQ
jgi:hypothetical protein